MSLRTDGEEGFDFRSFFEAASAVALVEELVPHPEPPGGTMFTLVSCPPISALILGTHGGGGGFRLVPCNLPTSCIPPLRSANKIDRVIEAEGRLSNKMIKNTVFKSVETTKSYLEDIVA